MQLIPVISKDQANDLSQKKLPVLAVDLGFASIARSCGLSDGSGSLTFADCVRQTKHWLAQNGQDSETVLIIEGPLSAYFDSSGNPMARASFEEHSEQTHAPSDRRWHVSAGAAMSLAAIHFLRQLLHEEDGLNRQVHLVEGFVSRYAANRKPSHQQVANALARAWRTRAWQAAGDRKPELIELGKATNSTVFAAAGLFLPELNEQPPIILRLPDGLNRQDIDQLYPLTAVQ